MDITPIIPHGGASGEVAQCKPEAQQRGATGYFEVGNLSTSEF